MKNIYKSPVNGAAILLAMLTALTLSCNRTRWMPGWDYFPDMFYSAAYETYTRNPNFKNDMTMRVPPDSTAPRGFTPFKFTVDLASRAEAGIELKNPFLPTDTVIGRGREMFTIFCSVCHGPKGDGNGHIYTLGLYPIKPSDLTSAQIVQLKDGVIYHTITLGYGVMGSYGSQVPPADRWKILLYVRQLQENAGVNMPAAATPK